MDNPEDFIAESAAEALLQDVCKTLRADYANSCKLVADMHDAASGRPGDGPRRGVIEDVADLRAALVELLARAEREICDPIDVPEIQQARHVLGLGAA